MNEKKGHLQIFMQQVFWFTVVAEPVWVATKCWMRKFLKTNFSIDLYESFSFTILVNLQDLERHIFNIYTKYVKVHNVVQSSVASCS